MATTHPTPRTDAAVKVARDALDAISPAVQQDIRAIVAGLIEAGNIPAAREAVNQAAAMARSGSDIDNVVVAQEQIRAAAKEKAKETVVVHDDPTPEPQPTPRPRQRYTPPAPAGDDDSEAPAWFAGFAGNFGRWTADVDDTLENHEDRISALERGEVRQDDGTYVPIIQRVVNGSGGIAKVGLAFVIGLVLGIIAFILLVGNVGIVPGLVLAIAAFLLGTGVAVALFNRTHTAPAR